jgi:hypothetical protein
MNPIASFWRGLFDARAQGTSAAMNALGQLLVQNSRGQTRVSGERVDCRPRNQSGNTRQGATPQCYVAVLGEEMSAIPRLMAERFFVAFGAPGTQTTCRDSVCRESVTGSTAPDILVEADDFLSSVPGEGALLADLVDHVALKTGCEEKIVRSVILRNYPSNGHLVWKAKGGVHADATISHMKRTLQCLGYTDLRHNYPLTAIPERDDHAALIAFEGSEPVVLCYPVYRSEVGDPLIREAAFFQAGAVAINHTAHYVWVSDGVDDFFYDFRRSVVISELPSHKPTVVVQA